MSFKYHTESEYLFLFTFQFFNTLVIIGDIICHKTRKQIPRTRNTIREGAKTTAFTLFNIFSVCEEERAVICIAVF